MAKIIEELIIIKLSRLVKDNDRQLESTASEEVLTSLETVVQELVGSDIIVEVSSSDVN